MGEMIRKSDANPIVFGLTNFFLFGCVGYLLMGQHTKVLPALLYTVVFSFCLGPVPSLIFAYDAYVLGQKLQSGESIGERENGLEFLDNLPGFN